MATSHSDTDFITVLQSAGRDSGCLLTKTLGRDPATGNIAVNQQYARVGEFRREVRTVRGPHDFANKLGKLLSAPTCAIIHDRPCRPGTVGPRRQEYFEPVAHRWLWLDIDGITIPEERRQDLDARTVDGLRLAGDWLLATYFPREFHGCFRSFLASSSTGLSPAVLKLHVALWCERPVSTDDILQLADALHVAVNRRGIMTP